MNSKSLLILLTCACASLARADFNPVTLTANSYTFDIVVESNTVLALPYCINVTAGSGTSLGDNTYYEQGLYARAGQSGGNSGIPIHNTTFNSINNANLQFRMPPDYSTNNTLMIDSTFTSGTLNFNASTTATNLAILECGGGGNTTVGYTVTHADTSTETGTLVFPDWFNTGTFNAWGANGRITSGGAYNNFNSSSVNNNAPFLHATNITVSGASPITKVAFTFTSGAHANIFAISGKNTGATTWTAIPVGGFNCRGIVPAAFPLSATMDQGTNTVQNGNLATWFEIGYVSDTANHITNGLPPSGSIFNSLAQPTHHYQMGNYSTNNGILVDLAHPVVNITPAVTTNLFSAFALLTAGGNVGGANIMTNVCILQHADGVNETNLFFGYDWFNSTVSPAFIANGRVNMSSRTVNNLNNNNPRLFESYFVLNDVSSPVTNIVVKYQTSPGANSTTFIMAVSATAGGFPALVNAGPAPSSQTLYPGQVATFSASASGTAPLTNYWRVQKNGAFIPLADGVSANGSIIIGSQTPTLTISNLYLADGTNYQFIAANAFGTNTSPNGLLIVSPQTIAITPNNPSIYSGSNLTLTVNSNPGAPVSLQWYNVDLANNTNAIPGATNLSYTITNPPSSLNGYTFGVVASNIYGTNNASVVVSVTDVAASFTQDLRPANGEAFAGSAVTYAVKAQGSYPVTYQWTINGNVISGATTDRLIFPAALGANTVQVGISNAVGGVLILSSPVTLVGIPYRGALTLNSNGTGWQTNSAGAGNVPTIANNVLTLTDGTAGEASSAFYNAAQYVGGKWTASFTYNSHGGGADGTCFILQTVNPAALGGTGGFLGYGGTTKITNSLAFQINLFGTPGITLATNGNTGPFVGTGPVSVTSANDINVTLNWSNGVLAATLTDAVTAATYSTNYSVGSLVDLMGANVAYVGFSGGDGGVTSVQTVSNFQFVSSLTPVSLAVASSSPTSGYQDSVNFTATVQTNGVTATDAAGFMVFSTTGGAFSTNAVVLGTATSLSLANLPRGTDLITAVYSGYGNYLPNTNSLSQVVTNHPPAANNNSYSRNGLNTWMIKVSDLLTNATDVDGDTLTLDSVGQSTNGITLVNIAGSPAYVAYANPSLVDDQFSYTVTDGFGGTNTTLITLTAGSSNGMGGQISGMAFTNGVASMTFAGIPGYLYHVQVSTNLSDWNDVLITNAPSGGVFQFNDNPAPLPEAFYRLMWNGN